MQPVTDGVIMTKRFHTIIMWDFCFIVKVHVLYLSM